MTTKEHEIPSEERAGQSEVGAMSKAHALTVLPIMENPEDETIERQSDRMVMAAQFTHGFLAAIEVLEKGLEGMGHSDKQVWYCAINLLKSKTRAG